MPHVDEGILHAYLDGALDALHEAGALPDAQTPADVRAHLQQCADCRSLLEVERAVRERAGLVLRDAAGPAVEAPAFETVARGAPRGRPAQPWLPYAWAASVLLAVGAGWWGSQLARDDGLMPGEPSRMESTAAGMADSPLRQVGVPDALADADATAAAGTDASRESAERSAPPAVVTAPVAGTGSAAPERGRIAANSPDSSVAAKAAEATARLDSGRAAASLAGMQSRAADVQVTAVNPLTDPRGASRAEQRALLPQAASAPPPPAPSLPMRPLPQADTDAVRFMAAVEDVLVRPAAWRAAAPEDSVRALGVAGVAAARVDIADVAGAGTLVRVRQRVDNGDVELIQWRAGPRIAGFALSADVMQREAAPATHVVIAPTELRDGVQQLIVRTADGTYVAIRSADVAPAAVAARLMPLR